MSPMATLLRPAACSCAMTPTAPVVGAADGLIQAKTDPNKKGAPSGGPMWSKSIVREFGRSVRGLSKAQYLARTGPPQR